MRLARFLSALIDSVIAAALIALMLAAYSPPFRDLTDRFAHAISQAERYGRYRAGLPLRGTPDLAALDRRLAAHGLEAGDPVFIRIFKRESELELWMRSDGRFVHFATYPICRWSGGLGPKLKTGDRQSPEGFYAVGQGQLNPASRWHRAFNLGFPNAHDRALGRTGSYLMVHGGCGSVGCYAMTNPVIDEIWRLTTAALDAGQDRFAVHVFPFRMTDDNLRWRTGGQWARFWRDLKAGYDHFEASHVPPRVNVCRGRYVVAPALPGDKGDRPITISCPAQPATS